MVVQHNLMAMNANRMLGLTTKGVSGSTEKLSSGYRINRAADDAAGLAISEKMRKQVRGLTQAASNAEDGVSCVQTAEGALAEVQDMLQRMNELCVQAANGTNSTSDRQYIQDELDQLISEIDRIAETTKFNETFLLKGDPSGASKSVYITDYSITYVKNEMSPHSVSAGVTLLRYKVNYEGTNNIYMVEDKILESRSNIALAGKVVRKNDDITPYMMEAPGVTSTSLQGNAKNMTGAMLNIKDYVAFVNVELDATLAKGADGVVAGQKGGATDDEKKADLSTNGIDDIVRANKELFIFNTSNETVTRITPNEEMTKYINDDNTIRDEYRLIDIIDSGRTPKTSERVKEQVLGGDDFEWTDQEVKFAFAKQKLYDSDGELVSGIKLNKYFDENGNYLRGLYTTSQARVEDEVFASTLNARFTAGVSTTIGRYISQSSQQVSTALNFNLHVGAQSERKNKICAQIETLTSAGIGIDKLASYYIGIVDETGDNATDAVDVVSEALTAISRQRSALGAVQNRLEHTIRNLDNIVENTTAAEAAIRDTDMAEEMVKYANANILQQAGQAMLAQANQANEGVLSLLQ